jgi:hypothetical protein
MAEFEVKAKVTPDVDSRDFTKSVEEQLGDITADIKTNVSGGGNGGSETIVEAITTQTTVLAGLLSPVKEGITATIGLLSKVKNGLVEGAFQTIDKLGGLTQSGQTGQKFRDTPALPPAIGEKVGEFEDAFEPVEQLRETMEEGDERGQATLLAPLEGIAGSVDTIKSFAIAISGAVSSAVGFLASLPVSLSTAVLAGVSALLAGLTLAFDEEIKSFADGVTKEIKSLLGGDFEFPSEDEVLSIITSAFDITESIATDVAGLLEDVFGLEEGTLKGLVSDLFTLRENALKGIVSSLFELADGDVLGAVEDVFSLPDGSLKSEISNLFDFSEDGALAGIIEDLFDVETDPEEFFVSKIANPFIKGVNKLLGAVNGLIKTIPKSVRKASGVETVGKVDLIETGGDEEDTKNESETQARSNPPRKTGNGLSGANDSGDQSFKKNIAEVKVDVRQARSDRELANKVQEELRKELTRIDSTGL